MMPLHLLDPYEIRNMGPSRLILLSTVEAENRRSLPLCSNISGSVRGTTCYCVVCVCVAVLLTVL
jgi:hypothetical protein